MVWISSLLRKNMAFDALSSVYYLHQTVLLKKPEYGITCILSECCIEIAKCISQSQVKELDILIQIKQRTPSSDSLLPIGAYQLEHWPQEVRIF